jgi:hypothetical protein
VTAGAVSMWETTRTLPSPQPTTSKVEDDMCGVTERKLH